MALLELTLKEAEMVKNALLAEKSLWKEVDRNWGNRTNADSNADVCDAAIAKVDAACEKQPEVLITNKDLFFIISNAKSFYSNIPSNVYISNKKIEENDFKHIALVNSIVMWLNGKNLVKKLVKFDYTDHSCQYEELE